MYPSASTMNPVPSPRRTLPDEWLRVAPSSLAPSEAAAWTAVMCTTAGLTRATTSAKDGLAVPAAASVPPGRGMAPPPPASTPMRPAVAATSANDRASTGRGMFVTPQYTGPSGGKPFVQQAAEARFVQRVHAQLGRLVELGAGRLAVHD